MTNIKNWDAQPFLERLLFLMNEYSISQADAEVLAKLDLNKLNDKLDNLLN
jgi:hypothetical protein